MKKLYFSLCTILVLLCMANSPVHALYDPRTIPNNKVGVHILNPSELEQAKNMINNHSGDWGYVTIPMQPSDRDKDKWQAFMHQCRDLHIIPIVRITTIPAGGTWATGKDTDLVDFANFLNELDWPIENRYIVLFNEVNRATEWGGTVDPGKYTLIVKNARTIFKERSENFFLLGPGLDDALPNSSTSLSATSYLQRMSISDPLIWSYFDGWAAHSYPNPGFSAPAKKTGLQSIVGYKAEFTLLHLASKPVFITETGWDQTRIGDTLLDSYWNTAWSIWRGDENVVAVTPFVLQGGEQFKQFSLLKDGGDYTKSGQILADLEKVAGSPKLQVPIPSPTPNIQTAAQPSWDLPFFKASRALLKLENIFRVVTGLPMKGGITLATHNLIVELAQTSGQWEKGLSGRTNLSDIDGMLFVFPRAHVPIFWMKDMHFPIDIIWLNHNKIVDITPSVPVSTSDKLPTYSPKEAVNMVLEVPSGWGAENNIAIGDSLTINE